MRKIVVSEFLSLDGVATDPHTFLTDPDDDVMDADAATVIATQDTVILGRHTYDEWAPFWPTSDIEPFASFINAVPKHIVTSRPLEPDWSNARAETQPLVEFARSLKAGPGGDIGVHGSVSVATALLQAGLVDELRLVIVPVIAGTGRRLLDEVPFRRLDTISSTLTPTGKLLMGYRVRA